MLTVLLKVVWISVGCGLLAYFLWTVREALSGATTIGEAVDHVMSGASGEQVGSGCKMLAIYAIPFSLWAEWMKKREQAKAPTTPGASEVAGPELPQRGGSGGMGHSREPSTTRA